MPPKRRPGKLVLDMIAAGKTELDVRKALKDQGYARSHISQLVRAHFHGNNVPDTTSSSSTSGEQNRPRKKYDRASQRTDGIKRKIHDETRDKSREDSRGKVETKMVTDDPAASTSSEQRQKEADAK